MPKCPGGCIGGPLKGESPALRETFFNVLPFDMFDFWLGCPLGLRAVVLRIINRVHTSLCECSEESLHCCQEEETLQHLLETCSLANQLWDKVSFRCQKRCKGDGDIIDSIRQWPKSPYDCAILNHLWNIIPGTVLWNIWKERNRRVGWAGGEH